MKEPRSSKPSIIASLVLGAILAAPASGHVELFSPNGGEQLEVGATFAIMWTVAIQHGTQDWDLWYGHGPEGPWIPVAEDLPVGDPVAGSMHTFEWTVPDDPAAEVWVRVQQDNDGEDYDDISDASFTISGACAGDVTGDMLVGFDDVLGVISAWGPCGGGPCAEDLDGDENVGFDDLLRVTSNWGPC